jgi:hypothetical protein
MILPLKWCAGLLQNPQAKGMEGGPSLMAELDTSEAAVSTCRARSWVNALRQLLVFPGLKSSITQAIEGAARI